LNISSKVYAVNYGVNLQLFINDTWKTIVILNNLNDWCIMELSYIISEEGIYAMRWSPIQTDDAVIFIKEFNLTIQ